VLFFCTLLIACTGAESRTVAEVEQAADSADQLMINLSTVLTDQGVRQAHLEADTAFVYETAGFTELRAIRVTFFTTTGVETSVLTAREGTYNFRTGSMEARGNVVVVRTDGARLTTSVLRFDPSRNEVSTDRPYTYDAPDRHVEGDGFTSDPAFSNIVTQRPRGSAGRFTLPGQ
jgi:LPS export ABC transporter protein LptC